MPGQLLCSICGRSVAVCGCWRRWNGAPGGTVTETKHAVPQLARLQSEDEARAWVLELVSKCEDTRRAIDVASTVRQQRKLFCQWMLYQGQALGVVATLLRCGMTSEQGYRELRKRVIETEKPTIVPFIPTLGRW